MLIEINLMKFNYFIVKNAIEMCATTKFIYQKSNEFQSLLTGGKGGGENSDEQDCVFFSISLKAF